MELVIYIKINTTYFIQCPLLNTTMDPVCNSNHVCNCLNFPLLCRMHSISLMHLYNVPEFIISLFYEINFLLLFSLL